MNFLKIFTAALLFTATVACEEAANNDDQGGNNGNTEQKDYFTTSPFTLKAEEITPVGFTLDVNCGDYDNQYYVACVFKKTFINEFDSDLDAMTEKFIADVKGNQLEVTDFSEVDNWKIFRHNSKVDMEAAWEVLLNPESEVVAFVVGVDDNGALTTAPQSLEVQMDPQAVAVDSAPTIKEVEVKATSITVEVDPGEEIKQYIVVAVPTGETAEGGYYESAFEKYKNPDPANADDNFYDYIAGEVNDRWDFAAYDILRIKDYIDYTNVDNVNLFSGVQEVTLKKFSLNIDIYPNKNYTVMAFGVDQYGFLLSKVGHLDVRTPAPEKIDLSFSIKFDKDKFTEDGFTFTVTPSDPEAKYYMNVRRMSEIDKLGGADATGEAIYNVFADQGVQWDLTYGEQTRTYGYLDKYEWYYVVLFGYNGGITSDFTLFECKTGILLNWLDDYDY